MSSLKIMAPLLLYWIAVHKKELFLSTMAPLLLYWIALHMKELFLDICYFPESILKCLKSAGVFAVAEK